MIKVYVTLVNIVTWEIEQKLIEIKNVKKINWRTVVKKAFPKIYNDKNLGLTTCNTKSEAVDCFIQADLIFDYLVDRG